MSNIVIKLLAEDEDGNEVSCMFYGEEEAPKDLSAIYWAVRQGGWEEPIEAYRDTEEKMLENLGHLEHVEDALPENWNYDIAITVDYSLEQISIADANNAGIDTGLADWIEQIEDYMEYTLGQGNIFDSRYWTSATSVEQFANG
jgi:hypothetical protein